MAQLLLEPAALQRRLGGRLAAWCPRPPSVGLSGIPLSHGIAFPCGACGKQEHGWFVCGGHLGPQSGGCSRAATSGSLGTSWGHARPAREAPASVYCFCFWREGGGTGDSVGPVVPVAVPLALPQDGQSPWGTAGVGTRGEGCRPLLPCLCLHPAGPWFWVRLLPTGMEAFTSSLPACTQS